MAEPARKSMTRFILGESEGAPAPPGLSREELEQISVELVARLSREYRPPVERRVTPERVYQPAVTLLRPELEAFQMKLFQAGSGIDGLDQLERCLEDLARGRTVVFLSEHRGNLDAPSFNALVRAAGRRYEPILDKLIYIAGRKLNESSEFINMFAEKYSRLVIVPRREFPPERPEPTAAELAAREAFEKEARRINWAAFRAMEKLKREGHIFVLFPTGGRIKPHEHNQPVRETTSYLRTFDTAYLISMDGNTLPPLERMEDERPIQNRVLFRIGPPLETREFLEARKAAFEAAAPEGGDFDQYVADRIMAMLQSLREMGRYEG
jgi:1-acyl-sn-glycerol-3-phosphate acyltransferase